MKKFLFLASSILLLLAASCQKEEPVNPNDSNNPGEITPETSLVEGLAFMNSEYEVFQYDTIGIKQDLRIFPVKIASKVRVKFQSSDPSVATVNAKGEVVGVGEGEALIWASANGKGAKCKVSVYPFVAPQSLSLNHTSFKLLTNGATLQLKATVGPENAIYNDFEWTSSNPSVATVSATGLVTSKSNGGNTTITCKHTATNEFDKDVSVTCNVKVVNDNDLLEMIYVEGGTFQMGATAEQGDDASDWEYPVHTVSLSSFYLSKTEITQAQYQAVMGENPSYYRGDNLPVDGIAWNNAQDFCEKLSQLTGKKYVLPTEAQWEYAARGGKQNEGTKYAGSNNEDEVAWHYDISNEQTHPVATKAPNALGLYDMGGNVFEWCADWYGDYSAEAQTNPTGPEIGVHRVIRGGSWFHSARAARVSYRYGVFPLYCNYFYYGFRVALLP